MLLSHLVTCVATWQANGPLEPDGTPANLTTEEAEAWDAEMQMAAACMLLLGLGPRRLIVFHPDPVA